MEGDRSEVEVEVVDIYKMRLCVTQPCTLNKQHHIKKKIIINYTKRYTVQYLLDDCLI